MNSGGMFMGLQVNEARAVRPAISCHNRWQEQMMESLALTRASTLGPIVDHIRRGGGSIGRVFKAADIPLELIDRPTALLPLRDHFKIVESAARELDDPALPARLAIA